MPADPRRCRRALVVGDHVEGRAPLRVPFDSPGNECQPYGLEREVHCTHGTYGQFASGSETNGPPRL